MNTQNNPGGRKELHILETRPHAGAFIPHAAIIAASAVLCFMKLHAPGIVLRFLIPYITSFTVFKALYWAEWAGAAAVALAAMRKILSIAGMRYVLTNRRIIRFTGSKRGEYLDLKDVFGFDTRPGAAKRATLGLADSADILVRSASGRHTLRDVPSPSAFIEECRKARSGDYEDPDKAFGNPVPPETGGEGIPFGKAGAGEEPMAPSFRPKNADGDIPAFMKGDWKADNPAGEKKDTEKDAEGRRIENPLQALDSLIGLGSVKDEVRSLSNFITVQKKRASAGLPQADLALHTIFKGNPGTGKTTVARIMASVYYETGVLPKGHLVETDRSGLVAEYVGQTAKKTNETIDKAIGGVLFVDEAYSLTEGGESDYGREAVTTLLKRMEDDREKFAVILAGYPGNMEEFLESNPGLRSRFARTILFPDYTGDELLLIFLSMAAKSGYTLSEDAGAALEERIRKDVSVKDHNFGNARYVRNLFEKSIQNQADRLMLSGAAEGEGLSILEAVDIHL